MSQVGAYEVIKKQTNAGLMSVTKVTVIYAST